jgi:hypothetical protein
MLQALPFPVRVECPPGACVCNREALLSTPDADTRILRLTREEEKRLLARIDAIATYDELLRLNDKLKENLGITVHIAPSAREVRSARGIEIVLDDFPGLCRKTRQAIPTAIRRCLDRHPDIIFAILNANDLFGAE